jgi:hypothetical protein
MSPAARYGWRVNLRREEVTKMTWNAALVISYGVPVPGREAAAVQNFADAQNYFGKLAADEKCEYELFQFPDGGGMGIVKADSAADLQAMLEADEGRKLLAVATYTSLDFGYRMAFTGDAVGDAMTRWVSVGSELGYLN